MLEKRFWNEWYSSTVVLILSNRPRTTSSHGTSYSDPVTLETGFPQGPGLYNKYTRKLGDLIRTLMIIYHLFADECQILKSLNPNSTLEQYATRAVLENGIEKVSEWMKDSRLKLNESKTELIIFGSSVQLKKLKYSDIDIGGNRIDAKPSVRNLRRTNRGAVWGHNGGGGARAAAAAHLNLALLTLVRC